MATKQLIDGVLLVRVNGTKREVRVISSHDSALTSDLSFDETAIVNDMLSAAAAAAGGCTALLVGGTWTCQSNGCAGACQLIATTYDAAQGGAVQAIVQGTSIDLDGVGATTGYRCECSGTGTDAVMLDAVTASV